MTPAERVAVLLEKRQMEGIEIDTPSIHQIQKDLEVGYGTAQLASAVAKANDPALVQALSCPPEQK